MTDSKSGRRAVITGIGPITSIGEGLAAFWEGILSGKGGIGALTRFDAAAFHAKAAAEINAFNPRKYFPPHRLKRLDRYAQFAVASARLALEDAGFDVSRNDPRPGIGVSFGTALGGVSDAEFQHDAFRAGGIKKVNPSLALQIFGGSGHSNIAIEFGFQGPGTTNSNSCASGTVAIGEALNWIRRGWADVVIAGGAEAPLSPLTFGAFDLIHTMSRCDAVTACRPFDLHRDGFVMGEGAASLVIEEYEIAKRRGAHIYAEVMGFSLSNDAFHMTSPRPDGVPATRTMQAALDDARVRPEEIDYINAHASSTRMNDANEVECLGRVFGSRLAGIPVSGTKPYTGHPLGAAGAMEAAICALAIDRGFIPPTLNYETPDPACAIDVVPQGREGRPQRVLSNSFGFGGINACLVLGAV